jgi:hypothetical protein
MSEERRHRNAPGVPSPGIDYVAATGLTPEERAETDVASLAAQKAAEIAGNGPAAEQASSAKEIAGAIASALAELVGTANGGGRKAISPQVLKDRREAWEKMEELLAHYRVTGEKPIYELTGPLFCDDVMIEPTYQVNGATIARRINFIDIPNEQMVPKNDSARRVMELFLRGIGGKTPDLGDTTYEAYLNRPRIAQVIGEPQGTPMVGSPGRLHEARATILEDTPAEERRYVGPQKQMGTVLPEIPSI